MFRVKSKNNLARHGRLETAHGAIETPFFMPIATRGAVKTMSSEDVRDLGAQIVLSNTYHLLLRPGSEGMKKLGGLHEFMHWGKPILTDSGGYQVFSLAKINATDDDGVSFQSHIDGTRIRLTPEGSMAMQAAIGSDIIMQFDDVAAGDSSRERYQEAMERSLGWARRCKDSYDQKQQIFGIVQGGTHEDLRRQSAEGLMDIGFDGYAIGGLSVGEKREDAFRITKFLGSTLPEDKPRYFMGGGMPEEIVYYVSVGVDMFDCVLPTRNARHGTLFVWKQDPKEAVRHAFQLAQEGANDAMIAENLYQSISITKEPYAFDLSPIDQFSDVVSSKTYTKAYLRHLFKTDEMLGLRLATMQNLGFYLRLMKELRRVI
ncbi:MAG: tRNA guanosine(34) transglycosylase Tgt [Patescibacteria group bacterium]|nr:tRNA guanosine(34) transglycosylase Tgt [Patescibacteria group bacterium]